MRRHDFRSDTVTLPTPAMMAAIARAPLGDAARGDDPTVNELERLAAEITGKEEALFLPSGAMANLAALIAHDCRGGEVIVEEAAHIYGSEGGGLSVVAGAIARPIRGERGILAPSVIATAIRGSADLALAPTRLICLENTHNASGGRVMPLEVMAEIHAVARAAGISVHFDGARLFNAAAYLGAPIAALCQYADSVWFALCKGLGGPIGAILAGDAAFMRKARRAAKMLGGGMRQAGLIAAPAIVALQDPYDGHRRDHELARRLARGLAALRPGLLDAPEVQTNIVNCFIDDAAAVTRRLGERGVLAIGRGRKIRFVTHRQVDDVSVDAAIAAFADILEGP
ncbi:MAG: low specificity L-threonine aldolase [Alphaproteobacteria bacterium]|nr:low specificity L-threonine aldolase [Alphaproteobacteria bacterium]